VKQMQICAVLPTISIMRHEQTRITVTGGHFQQVGNWNTHFRNGF